MSELTDPEVELRPTQKTQQTNVSSSPKNTTIRKTVKGPSFGSSLERFGIVSFHPRMWTQVTNKAFTRKHTTGSSGAHLSPASYNIRRLWEAEENETADSAHGWARQQYVERLAALPSIVNRHLFEVKRELRRRLGPGTYNIATDVKKPGSIKPFMDSTSERFPRDPTLRFCTPGPGFYGKDGIPRPQLGEKKEFGTYSFLEKRVCKRSMQKTGTNPPPGAYNFKDSLQQFLDKKVGKKGPYKVFTGSREDPIKVGHRPTVPSTNPNLQYDTKEQSIGDTLLSRHDKKGEWSKAPQYPARSGERICHSVLPAPVVDSIKPGPADYSGLAPMAGVIPGPQREAIERLKRRNPMFGFDCLTKREFTYQNLTGTNPGPGRYRIKRIFDNDKKPTESSVFKKSTYKLDYKKHNFFRHRLRAKNVAVQNRAFIIQNFVQAMIHH